MGRHKSDEKKQKPKKRGSQLVIRVTKEERDTFVKLCDEHDTKAAREIRRFMREWVAAHEAGSVVPESAPEDDPGASDLPAGEAAPAEGTDAAKPKARRKRAAP